MFQPKESALILFREPDLANAAISFGGSYLSRPNIGIQGSRGAAAIPLLATMIAWGKRGLVERIDRTMAIAQQLAERLNETDGMCLWAMPKTGITVFRPHNYCVEDFLTHLPEEMLSTCILQDEQWLRSVVANPVADINAIWSSIQNAIHHSATTG